MAKFDEHLGQVKRNLSILNNVNLKISDSWDWQVTISYYAAVHLMNAHMAKLLDLHYNTHEKVKNALFNEMSPCKIPDDIYAAYIRLEGLSRRARYLCHENGDNSTEKYLTHDRHLKKSLTNLDRILNYFKEKYSIQIHVHHMDFIELKGLSLSYFKYKQST